MTFRLGASTGCCPEMPIVPVIRALADVGIRGIEIGTPPRHFDVWEHDQVIAVERELKATGIEAVAIHAPFGGALDLADPNPRHRNAAIGAILMAADVLRELGGRIVVVHASDQPRSLPDARERRALAAASLCTLQAGCLQRGMTLALESPLGHLIGGTPAEFTELLAALGPEGRVCLDTGHTTLAQQWDAFAALAAGRLVHVHAHDHRGTFDDHLPPGDGSIDWRAIAAPLHALRYDGWVMLELRCPDEPMPAYFARAARQLRDRLEPAVTRAVTPA